MLIDRAKNHRFYLWETEYSKVLWNTPFATYKKGSSAWPASTALLWRKQIIRSKLKTAQCLRRPIKLRNSPFPYITMFNTSFRNLVWLSNSDPHEVRLSTEKMSQMLGLVILKRTELIKTKSRQFYRYLW